MSWQVGSACYPSEVAAAAASASSQVGTVVAHGSASYVVNASATDGASITYVLTPLAGGTAITLQAPYTAQPCGLLTHSDGLQLAWMTVAVWAAVFTIKFLATSIQGFGDQHGNT